MAAEVCAELLERLGRGIASQFEAYPEGKDCVIVTPFTYPDLASIEIRVLLEEDSCVLTDEGETLGMLHVNGLTLEAHPPLMREATAIAAAHGIRLHDSTLSTEVTADRIAEAVTGMVNAIQAVGHLLYRRRHRARPEFADELERLLIAKRVPYSPGFMVRGAANVHRIAFHVDSGRDLLVEPLSATTVASARTKARITAYKWIDIKRVNDRYHTLVVVDDREGRSSVWADEEAWNTVRTYSDRVVRWLANASELTELVAGELAG